MSTRANIKVIEGDAVLWFYRHSDGYPEGAMPLLNEFMGYLESGAIRQDISQASGWLILLGHQEYIKEGHAKEKPDKDDGFSGWKVGSIEPTTQQHGDIEYLYTIDIKAKSLTYIPV